MVRRPSRGPPHGVAGAWKSPPEWFPPLSAVARTTAGVRLRPSQAPGEWSGGFGGSLGTVRGGRPTGAGARVESSPEAAAGPSSARGLPQEHAGDTRSGSAGPRSQVCFEHLLCAGTRARHGCLAMKRPHVQPCACDREEQGPCVSASAPGLWGRQQDVGVGQRAVGSRGGGPGAGWRGLLCTGQSGTEALGVRRVFDDLPGGAAGARAAAGPAGRAGLAEGFGHRRQSAAGDHEVPKQGAVGARGSGGRPSTGRCGPEPCSGLLPTPPLSLRLQQRGAIGPRRAHREADL